MFTTLRALPSLAVGRRTSSPRASPGVAGGSRERERITVLITHRLANVRQADQIVVLSHGRVTATGTHDQLIDAPGDYRELFRLQADAYQSSGSSCL